MSKNKDIMKLKGTIIKCLPGAKFIVKADEVEVTATCSLSGKLRQNKITLVENDKVDFEISVYDLTTGRIVWRY
jgi:translation initiation factor IF-1